MKIRPSSAASIARAAFTLIELVVSAGLMSIILVSGYLCLNSGLATQQLVEQRGDQIQSARVALNRMSADLRAACALSKDVQFAGLDRTMDGVEADNMDFGTHHYRPQAAGEGDFCQMSYFVARVPESDDYALWRRRHAGFGVNPLAGGKREEIVRGVRGLKLEYYDGLDWHDEWGDPDGRSKARFSNREDRKRTLTGLPDAVRITLWIGTSTPMRPASSAPLPSASSASASASLSTSSATEGKEASLMFQTIVRLQLAGRSDAATGTENRESPTGENQNPGTSSGPPDRGGNP